MEYYLLFCVYVCNTLRPILNAVLLYHAEPNSRIKFGLSMTFETIQLNGLNKFDMTT